MMCLKMNTRKLLKVLMTHTQFSLQELQQLLQVSKRTFYYTLEEVNDLLLKYKMEKIKVFNETVKITTSQQIAITEIVKKLTLDQLILTPKERQLLLLFHLLTSIEVNSREFMKLINISKATFYEDIAIVKGKIHHSKCQFIKLPDKYRYKLIGSEEYRRSLLINTLKELTQTINLSSIPWIPQEKFKDYEERFKKIHSTYPILHNHSNLELIMIMLEFGYGNVYELNYSNKLEHLQLVQKYFKERSPNEIQFLSFLLYGGSTIQLRGNNHLYTTCKELVERFEEKNTIRFEQKQDLIQEIYSHLLIHGYLLMVEDYSIHPETIEKIINQYNELYLKVEQCIRSLSYQPLLLEDKFIKIGIMLKIGVYLRKGAFVEVDEVVFIYIDSEPLFTEICLWIKQFDKKLKIINMMDFTYMPEEERKAKLIITNVLMSEAYQDIPTILVSTLTLEEKIKIMLLLKLSQRQYNFDTTFKIFNVLKDDMSLYQIQYYIKKLS